jgi:hypothetical protein
VSGSGRDFPKDCECVAVGYLNQANKVIMKNQFAVCDDSNVERNKIYLALNIEARYIQLRSKNTKLDGTFLQSMCGFCREKKF